MIGGAAMSHERVGASSAPRVGATTKRKSDTPIASTTAAVHPSRSTWRRLMTAPRKSESSSDVARIGSTITSVPVPSAIASNT